MTFLRKKQRQEAYQKKLEENIDRIITDLKFLIAAQKREKVGKKFLDKHPKRK